MANTAHLFRRQSSREFFPSSYHRSLDSVELKVSDFSFMYSSYPVLIKVSTFV